MPGEEFRVALQEAQAIGAKVMLGDRNVNITLKRTWAALSPWQRVKFLFSMAYQGLRMPDPEELTSMLEQLKETDMLTKAIQELSKDFPSLAEPLIFERDRYMVHSLRSVAPFAAKVVAVVGAGHLPGIRENWERDIDIGKIVEVPLPRRGWWPGYRAIGAAAALSAAGLAVYRLSRR